MMSTANGISDAKMSSSPVTLPGRSLAAAAALNYWVPVLPKQGGVFEAVAATWHGLVLAGDFLGTR